MAANVRNSLRHFRRCFSSYSTAEALKSRHSPLKTVTLISAGSVGVISAIYYWRSLQKAGIHLPLINPVVIHAKDAQSERADVRTDALPAKRNIREERFLAFGSVEFDGNVYMTPEDFLESVTEPSPRARTRRRVLNKNDVDKYLKETPQLHRGTHEMFRHINHKGLLSYTEYLFLLCVLTKPESGFQIAFNMFDTDGNQMVEKKEFLVLLGILSNLLHINNPALKRRRRYQDGSESVSAYSLSKIFLPPKPDQDGADSPTNEQRNIWDSNSPECEIQDTTLLRHFFGARGTGVLKYKDFAQFMDNLQTEVLELEFNEFSRGMATISESEFAQILMRYTKVDHGEHDEYIKRVEERIGSSTGIKFDEFKKFFQFLNNLDDFTIAMRFFTFGNKPVSQEEFQRAVDVCVGYSLSPHLLNTVFTMFDEDGDGHLTQGEFISIMKDRVHRGVRTHLLKDQTRWDMFRACVKNEMRKP